MLKQRSSEYQSQGLRSRSPWILVLVGALVLGVVGAGIWLIVASDGADDLEAATDLADDWLTAWDTGDPEAVAALYTEDGVHVPPAAWNLDTAVGIDAIREHAMTYQNAISESSRTGDAITTEPDFTFPIEFRADGKSWVADVWFELDGNRASRVEFVTLTNTSLASATDLADEWLARWSGTDAEAIAALYTADGIHVPPPEWNQSEAVGREAILAHAERYAESITDAQRTGDLSSAATGTVYRFSTQFVADGDTYDGVVEITLDGELASRVEFVTATPAG